MRHYATLAIALAASVSLLHAQSGDPPSRVARISVRAGQASLQPSGASEWGDASLNGIVTTGDRLVTGADGQAELEIGPMSVRIAEGSDVTVTNLADRYLQLGLEQGTLRLSVYRLSAGDSIEVDTPNGALMVTTPGEYRFEIADDDSHTTVSVDVGGLEIVGPGVNQIVRGGQAVRLTGTDRIDVVSVVRPARTSFDQWAADRDHRVNTASCAQYMSNDIPGCADLDDAGRWEANADFGTVWYPTRVAAGWVPYRDGRWVWVEPWGWSWIDDAPWGYAPFHYGRWAQFGPRWGWIPGPLGRRPYYAPALVAFIGGPGWRVGVSSGTQAWFPLGPHEAYFPSYHHGDDYLRRVNSANVRNVGDITVFVDARNAGRMNYANRATGMTAVPTDAFRNGRPVGRAVVKLSPDAVGRGAIIAHPETAPDQRAVFGGRPAARPPTAQRPPMITMATPRTAPERAPFAPNRPARTPAPILRQTPPPSEPAPPVQATPRTPTDARRQPRDVRPIITRSPPPLALPPFPAREPALQAHPGKPLEPQQTQNVRAGRPAGPPRDIERPAHPVDTPNATPAKPQAPAKQRPAPAGSPTTGARRDTTVTRRP